VQDLLGEEDEMIHRQSHTLAYVLDQERARKFYVEKLGFEVRTDEKMNGKRWLTVGPGAQPEVQVVLMEAPEYLQPMIKRGALGAGVFETDDCRATVDMLKSRGVEVTSDPSERPYGIEATIKDDSGNWLSVLQPRR
jgi:predicted enzyme related to lactoylglutathione lyase